MPPRLPQQPMLWFYLVMSLLFGALGNTLAVFVRQLYYEWSVEKMGKTTLTAKQRVDVTLFMDRNNESLAGMTPSQAIASVRSGTGHEISVSAVKSISRAMGIELGTTGSGASATAMNNAKTLAITLLELCESLGHEPRLRESLQRIAENRKGIKS